MASSQLPKTYHIFYAWAEGPWHGKVLVEALERAGYTEAPLNEATVVIAHSVGCFLLKPTDNNKIVFLIGPPFWPGKPIRQRMNQKIWLELKSRSRSPLSWAQKLFWNLAYILTKPNMTTMALHALRSNELTLSLPSGSIVLQNLQDTFCIPSLSKSTKNKVIKLPGQHDDCWHNPQPYIKLIESQYSTITDQTRG